MTNALYLVTFAPLAATPFGRKAVERYGLPPFIDGSIRREPDLEHAVPSISCLCRAGKFAPRLQVGDAIAYMTTKRTFGGGPNRRHLAAILRPQRLFDSHAEAAEWYRGQSLPLPSNCMVAGNEPQPLDRSHGIADNRHPDLSERHRKWDQGYRYRARTYGRFIACEVVFRCLGWDAPVVHDADLKAVFGKKPGTQNPGRLPIDHVEPFMKRLQIAASPSSP